MARHPRGFTLLEVVIALVVLEVGVLGLLATAATATRLIGRARRATRVTTLAAARLERLRTTVCASRTAGSEVRGSADAPLDSIAWRFVDAGSGHWRIVLRMSSPTERHGWRADSLETEVSCRV
ncbi:MAG TPA: prepilin-type N-terminal cleavage/methylation domain-containing protein [Gemmatimonadales bacterium]|nr:prepilin-type N-terminal cleavage/methylation domain-containing protein [Gemmatimonadales bacterium]